MDLKTTCVIVVPEHWKKFRKLANEQGLNASSLVRQLIAKELRRAQQEEARSAK